MDPERSLLYGLRWPLVVVILGVLGLLALERTCATSEQTQQVTLEAAKRLGESAVTIAERFRSGTITTTFTAAIPRLDPSGHLRLELAVFHATESFTRADQRSILWDMVPLGTTVTGIRVPVTYRYHLRLDDPWKLTVREQACLVEAPRVRPSLPPAIHTDGMERHSQRGWLRFNVEEQMSELERSITPTLIVRASDPDHLELVRERCRTRVAEFVRTWLLHEDHWRPDRFRAIVVRFEDEPEKASTPGPTILWEELSPAAPEPSPR
jgi:hypothetical protein